MLALNRTQWLLLAGCALLYLFTCVRVSRWAAGTGRNPLKWFLVTLLLTAIPASLVSLMDRKRHLRRSPDDGAPVDAEPSRRPRRCLHCGKLILTDEPSDQPDITTCPHCGLPADGAPLA